MALDWLEIARQALADDGRQVTVTTEVDPPFPVTMLYEEPEEDARLGHLPAALNYPVFFCLPEDAAAIEKGTLLTLDGFDYLVYEVLPQKEDLTEIRVKEQ